MDRHCVLVLPITGLFRLAMRATNAPKPYPSIKPAGKSLRINPQSSQGHWWSLARVGKRAKHGKTGAIGLKRYNQSGEMHSFHMV